MSKNLNQKSTDNARKIDRMNQLRDSRSNAKRTNSLKPKVPSNHSGDYYSDKGNKVEKLSTENYPKGNLLKTIRDNPSKKPSTSPKKPSVPKDHSGGYYEQHSKKNRI